MYSFSSVIVMLNVLVSIWLVTHIDRFLRSHVMKNKTDTFEGHLNWEMRLFFSFLFDCFLCFFCTNYFENSLPMTKKQPFQCRLLECHATEQFGKSLLFYWKITILSKLKLAKTLISAKVFHDIKLWGRKDSLLIAIPSI